MRLVPFAALASLALSAALTAAPGTPPEPALKVTAIEARLFYGHSGRLSDDLLKRNPAFSGWNTVIGEGESGEPADDLLISIRLEPLGKRTPGESVYTNQPVTITAMAGGKVIRKRTFTGILTNGQGIAWKALYLADIGCIGDLKINVVAGNQRRNASLPFHCGE